MNTPSAPTRVPAFAALRHTGFRAYFVTSALAMMADSIEHVISYWIIFQKFQSPTLGGIAVLTHWLPFLLFSVYSGALADRFDPRRIIQLGMLLFTLVSAAWGLLFLTDTLAVWHAAMLLTVHGLAGVLWLPAAQLLVHDIVGREQLQNAVRLNATARQLGILLGPAIGGFLMLALSPAWGILVNVLIYLPLVWWLWKAPYGAHAAGRKPEAKPKRLGGWADIMSVTREVAGNRTIASMILLAGGASFFVGNAYQAQMPEFATDLGHGPLCADAHGFSLHAAVRTGAHQRKKLERLCRYITRPAIANERVKRNSAGDVVLQLKSAYRDGTTHIVMSPLEFMQRLAALVARPRLHLIRFHGVLAPNAKLRASIVPGVVEKPSEPAEEHTNAPARMSWARLLKRVFDLDIEHCPRCGGALKIIAAIEEPGVIRGILTHLGLPARAPPRAAARGLAHIRAA